MENISSILVSKNLALVAKRQTKSRGPRLTTSRIAARVALPAVTRKCSRDAETRFVRKNNINSLKPVRLFVVNGGCKNDFLSFNWTVPPNAPLCSPFAVK